MKHSMGISTKMVESEEFKNNQANLLREVKILHEQLEKVHELIQQENMLHKRGYEQYRTYAHNKRRDKTTNIPLNPIKPWEFYGVKRSVKQFIEMFDESDGE